MPLSHRLYAFRVMAYSIKSLKKAMALTRHWGSDKSLDAIPMEQEPLYLHPAVLDKSWYRIYVKQEHINQCIRKLEFLQEYRIIGGWLKDSGWNLDH